jgi:hypothetical protein
MEILQQDTILNKFKAVGLFQKGTAEAEAKVSCHIMFHKKETDVINFISSVEIESHNSGGGHFLFKADRHNVIQNNNQRPKVAFLLDLLHKSIDAVNNTLITECSVRGHGVPVVKKIADEKLKGIIVAELNRVYPPKQQG